MPMLGADAMPAENEKPRSKPASRRGSRQFDRIRRVTVLASSATVPGISTANSSPPIRNARSDRRRCAPEQLADLGQGLVADGVAGRVVDELEIVEVDEHERDQVPVAPDSVQLAIELFLERPVVAQPGERVDEGVRAVTALQIAELTAGLIELFGQLEHLAGTVADQPDARDGTAARSAPTERGTARAPAGRARPGRPSRRSRPCRSRRPRPWRSPRRRARGEFGPAGA